METKEIEIRIATKTDSQAIANLVNSVYRGDEAKKGWTTEADLLSGIRITVEKVQEIINTSGNTILLAILDDKLAGCVHLKKVDNNKAILGMLSVNVNFQTKGIGKMLITKSEEYVKESFGCSEMEMKVISVRKELIEYYQRRGYKLTGRTEPFVLKAHFGDPKIKDLEFVYLVKELA